MGYFGNISNISNIGGKAGNTKGHDVTFDCEVVVTTSLWVVHCTVGLYSVSCGCDCRIGIEVYI